MAEREQYNILSFDGGGVRGVFAARIMARLQDRKPDLRDSFDLYAGTSTGAILAVGLAMGIPASEIVAFYRAQSKAVFRDSIRDDIRDLGRLRGAEYDIANLKKVLETRFGAQRLGDIAKALLITAFDLDDGASNAACRSWKPKFFHNFAEKGADAGELALDVILRSCAAPVYFPSYQGYIDGGVVANNPSLAALAQAIASRSVPLVRVRILSLGTGRNPEYIPGKRLDWGTAQWAPIFTRLLSSGSMGVVNYQCRQLLANRYHRLDTVLKQSVPIDATDKIDHMIAKADDLDLDETLQWLDA